MLRTRRSFRAITFFLSGLFCSLLSLSVWADDPTLSPVYVEQHPAPRPSLEPIWVSVNRKFLRPVAENIHFSGFLRQETAYRVGDSSEWTKIRQSGLLAASGKFSESLRGRVSARAWYDMVYDATDNYDSNVRSSERWLLELRDAYLDYSQGPWDVRLGKQQIVWGDALGLFFADVVNAKDLREYVLPDFDLIRIPDWAADVEWSGDNVHAEFVWIPVLQFNRLGVRGSEFEFPAPVPPQTAWTYADPSKPPSSFSDSEVGTRVSYLWNGWDVSGFYLYTWDKFPVLYRSIAGTTFAFDPQYRREHLFGGSFSKDLGEVVLKGELVANPKSYLSTLDATDADGVVRRTTVDYLIGFDYTAFGRINTNVQLLQRIVGNHPDGVEDPAVRTHLSFWAKTDLLSGKVTPEVLMLIGLNEPDALYRPKITVKLTNNVQWRVGADIFQGRPGGLFGQFDHHSRVYSEVTYYF